MNVSLETIDYQRGDKFPPTLTALIEAIYQDCGKGAWTTTEAIASKHPAAKKIETLIFERFQLRMVLSPALHIFTPAAVIPFFRDKQTLSSEMQGFITKFSQEQAVKGVREIKDIMRERKATLKKIDNRTGFVNTKFAKVGGYLSEIRHFLIIDFVLFKSLDITPGELAAIVLHEIGHAFDGMEEHYRNETTNRAILDILVDLHENKPDKALYRYRNTFTKKEYEAAQISTSKDRQDFSAELARQYIKSIDSQWGNGKYDETNFENMADTFCARFGMAQELVSALVKLSRRGGSIFAYSRTLHAFMRGIDALALAVVFLLVPIYGFIIYTVVSAYFLRISANTMTYDEPIERLERVRNTVVNSIKNKTLPESVVSDALAQIEFIEKACRDNMTYKPLLQEVGDWLFADARADRYYIDFQQKIESQLNNRLFVQAAKLRVGL